MNFVTQMAVNNAVHTATQLVLRENQRRWEEDRKREQSHSNNRKQYRCVVGDKTFIIGSEVSSFMPSMNIKDVTSAYDSNVSAMDSAIVLDKIRGLKESEILIIKANEFDPVIESYLQDYEQITKERVLALLDKQDIEDGFYYIKKPTYKLISKEELLSNNENTIEDIR